MNTSSGIHHVTAICSDAQKNLDFYAGVLGLRLVKITVNFDDPFSYHLYYGDELGRPGTILTFFAWPNAHRATHGSGVVATISLAVLPGALETWKHRLEASQIAFTNPPARFGEEVLQFHDPDGLVLEIVASLGAQQGHAWSNGGVAPEMAIRGVHSVTLAEEGYEHTARLLTQTMGFSQVLEPSAMEPNRFRFAGRTGIGAWVDVCCLPDAPRASMGAGGVHHVAFRAADDAAQIRDRAVLTREGLNVSPVMDRQYFHSIYFREPGGVLFEIATDTPGFAWDEAPEKLGQMLKLPAWLETYRPQIEERLPKLQTPAL